MYKYTLKQCRWFTLCHPGVDGFKLPGGHCLHNRKKVVHCIVSALMGRVNESVLRPSDPLPYFSAHPKLGFHLSNDCGAVRTGGHHCLLMVLRLLAVLLAVLRSGRFRLRHTRTLPSLLLPSAPSGIPQKHYRRRLI